MSGEGELERKYIHAPFSVLDTRRGDWYAGRRKWNSMGIKGEIGRGDDLLIPAQAHLNAITGGKMLGTSIFDPYLCELMYSWFSPVGGMVLDPFAGGSVRGIIAGALGRNYTGIDLRKEQVDANIQQATEISAKGKLKNIPKWVVGDSSKMQELLPADLLADFVFSCPPYMDLERYSDDKDDLSTMDEANFFLTYADIISKAIQRLKPNRFACFVISEIRNKEGIGEYRHLLNNTVYAFEDAGAKFYDEIILVNSCGTLPVRVAKQWEGARKIGRHHQNIYVFVKGDPRIAAKDCGIITPLEYNQLSLFSRFGDVWGDGDVENEDDVVDVGQ